MVIIGLQSCPSCRIIRDRHKDLPYVELPRSGFATETCIHIKEVLLEHNIHTYPVLMNDEFTEIIPLSTIEPTLK